jgi:TonB-linked SusC/RagA family outer membrane protein
MKKLKLVTFVFLSLLSFLLSAQDKGNINLKGTVLDKQTAAPIIGATVIVPNTKIGVITDMNGNFEIKLPFNSQIKISYVGYKPQILSITSDNPLTVYLEEEKKELDEVVVIGYGVQKKSDITGAISSVSGKDISSMPVSSPLQGLQGRAAGALVIQNTGAPGGKTTIKIRGTGTINDSDPLYVVDGFIVDDIEHLNPNDILSMEILKDAASSSIYGSRAANGVILITTKQGETGKIKIAFDAYSGTSNPWKTIKVMNVDNFALMRDYVQGTSTYSADGKLYYSKDSNGNLYFDDEKYHRIDSIRNSSPESWWDAVTRTGIKQQYNLSLTGGNENHKYLISGNYYNEEGIVKTADYERLSLRLNLSNKIAKWLDMKTNFLYTNDDRHIVPEGTNGVLKKALYQNPLIYPYNNAGYYSEDHPIAMIERNHNESKTNRIDLNIDFSVKINKLLNYELKFSNYKIFYNQYRFNEVPKLEENFVIPTDLTKIIRNSNSTNKTEIDNLLTFNYNRNKHDVNIVGGQIVEMSSIEYLSAEKQGAPGNSSNYRYLSAAYYGDQADGTISEWSALGFLGRVNYAYNNKYLMQINFRADASSKFSPSCRWGYFPSVSLGWKFSGEKWMQNLDFISLGKIRVGWGRLGNSRIDDYARYTIIEDEYNYSYGSGEHVTQPGATAITLGNERIKWETTESYNVGLDLNFFNNRLNTTIEYFDKQTANMLLRVPVSLSAGLNEAPMVNAGNVSNKGFEFTINYKGNISKFKYEIGVNISHVKNTVTSLGTGNEPIYGALLSETSINDYVTKTEVGMPIGYFYGYVTDGIFQSQEEVEASAQNNGVTAPGDFRFKDLNLDGKIDASDRTYIGSPHPKYVFGVPLSLSYKNWDLSMFFQGQWGNKIFNVMEYYLNSAHETCNVYADLISKVWSSTNPNGNIPELSLADKPRNFRASDFYVKDGSYARLKDLTLNYNIPEKFLKRLFLSTASVYISSYNLLTFTKYDGLDPEVGKISGEESNNLYFGVDHGNYPQARSFLVGIKVTF